MSVTELQARIAKLSTYIDLQKEVLKHLEREKRLVQRRLNAVLDPVARLPLEISSEIFLCSLPRAPLPEPGDRHGPMQLLNICNAWTDIALSTPALWTAIHIALPYTEDLKEVVAAWLQRACGQPLTISLSVCGEFDEGVADIIWRRAQQLKHLQICEEQDYDGDSANEEPMDIFGGRSPRPLPMLETLAIRGTEAGRRFSSNQILELLRTAPNLFDASLNA
jgi:hypothetical protein